MLRRGVIVSGVAALAVTLLLALAGEPAAGGTPAPTSWAFAIGNGHLKGSAADVSERLGEFDLLVVDGEEATRAEIGALHDAGASVLAYLSVGTIEKWRSWYRKLKRYRLRAWQDWKDEWFADTSKRKLRQALARRIAPRILAKGFDGLFLDNVDMIETRNHRAQRKGMRKLVRKLARLVHRRDDLLFTQNGAWGLRKLGLLDLIDGWNREDVTWTFDFDRHRYVPNTERRLAQAQAELRRMAARGLITMATDYTKASDDAAEAEAVANACEAGALPYVSDIGLTVKRLPQPPLDCE
jgi:cysteinyl-tRNA synthetase, unknown class